jgi:hypothetical protein
LDIIAHNGAFANNRSTETFMQPTIQPWPEDSIESKAYAAVADLPTIDANDKNRLGYHVYLALTTPSASLDEAIHVAQPRLLITREEALERITAKLSELGIEIV